MIPAHDFPDLANEANNRGTARFMARMLAGADYRTDPLLRLLVGRFAQTVDGALLDYQLARAAYYQWHLEPALGATTPVSRLLIPYSSHVENCITNTLRAFRFGDTIRCRKSPSPGKPLVEKDEWRPVATRETLIRKLRDAVQHTEKLLLRGELAAAGLGFEDKGPSLVFDRHVLPLSDLAVSLRCLHQVSHAVVERLPSTPVAAVP